MLFKVNRDVRIIYWFINSLSKVLRGTYSLRIHILIQQRLNLNLASESLVQMLKTPFPCSPPLYIF
jgi:hypothetical protein